METVSGRGDYIFFECRCICYKRFSAQVTASAIHHISDKEKYITSHNKKSRGRMVMHGLFLLSWYPRVLVSVPRPVAACPHPNSRSCTLTQHHQSMREDRTQPPWHPYLTFPKCPENFPHTSLARIISRVHY